MKKPNIYLTGMMGAGKTTIGKLLAKKLRYQFVDTDALIVQKTQISINEIFAKYGEAYFRNLETKILSKLKKAKGLVVATGGGIILKDVNIKMMQASGQIFYLQRTCANIIKTLDSSKRPLLKNGKTKLFKIFATRKLCYLNTANYIMDNNCFDPSVTVKNIYLIIQQQEKFKIGYQGTIGAYGWIVANHIFPHQQYVNYDTFDQLVNALRNNRIDYAVMPYENIIAGPVKQVQHCLNKIKTIFYFNQPIDHILCALKGTKLSQIKTVISHPSALDQCKNYIKKNQWKTLPSLNTALSARDLNSPKQAVIASPIAAKEYYRIILAKNIANVKNNITRFLVGIKK